MTRNANKTTNEIEQEILSLLDRNNCSLDELVSEINAPKPKVETGIRRLLQRQLVGETADWKFFISVHGEEYLHADADRSEEQS